MNILEAVIVVCESFCGPKGGWYARYLREILDVRLLEEWRVKLVEVLDEGTFAPGVEVICWGG